MRMPSLTARQWLIVIHDLLATAAALVFTFFLRFEDESLAERLSWLPLVTLGLVAWAAVVYYVAGLHEAKWRFTSLPELSRIIGVSLVLATSLLVVDYILLSPGFYGTFFFGKFTIVLYFVIQTAFLSASRVAYRYFRDVRTQRQAAATMPFRRCCWAARPTSRCRCARSNPARSPRSGRSACCRRRAPIAASACAAFRCSATSTIWSA